MYTKNFENSAMKPSFSLSSLPVPETPERTAPTIREFSSLKKKRREPTKRLSWGSSTSEHDFWSINLKENYNYIMDNQLIDNCQDANCEINSDPRRWTIEEFSAQCSELYSWLNRIQEKIYGHKTSSTDKTLQDLRSVCKKKLLKKRPFYKLCKEQVRKLIKLLPERKEEFTCQINFLKEKWDSLETLLESVAIENDDDMERKIQYLNSWFCKMDSRLKPVSLRKEWTTTEKEVIISEQEVIYKDIENHKKIINSLKLCKGTNTITRKVIARLERRWLHLKLLSEEWQYYIEEYIKKDTSCLSDSDISKDSVKSQPKLCSEVGMKTWTTGEDTLDNNPENCSVTIDVKFDCTLNENKMLNSNDIEAECPRAVRTEDAQFNKSNRNAPNFATYYFKHVDTDSDLDHLHNSASENDAPANSETSEWIYTPSKDAAENSTTKKAQIQKIFKELEKMVSPEKRPNPMLEPPINKTMRIKEWLKIDKPDDSCDASSEDDDSESSEDQNESIATCRLQSLNASCADLETQTTPKVSMRHRYAGKGIRGQRPSSIACISQLAKTSRISNQPHSNSESALNKLKPDGNLSVSNSTSSTVEDSCAMQNDENSSPLRKKRFRLKKKSSSIFRKSSDFSLNYNNSGNHERGTLVKSGSFSGRSCLQLVIDRQTGSDTTVIPTGYGIETSTTSGADTDEERNSNRMPLFKIGAKTTYGLFGIRDDSPGKFGIEEQSSSLCDDAWDSYQEKYSSEAYSEAHDSDAARKLLEFGEDYRSFLGSQSDWSTQSGQLSPLCQKRKILPMNMIDSDSEANDLKELLKDSGKQWRYTEEVFTEQQSLAINQYLVNNDIKELVATCNRHIGCLAPVEKNPEEYKLTGSNKKEISGILLKWHSLKNKVSKLEEYLELQNDMSKLKQALCDIKIPQNLGSFTVNNIEDLNRDIDFYSAELANIGEQKKNLLKVNVAVNHFMTENTEYNGSTLKSDVSELYRIWFEINNRASDRINRLNSLLQSWQVLETRLDQLRGDLRDDEQTLGALDSALQGGTFSNQMAPSVRGVAKVLSETKTEGCSFPEIFMEGSFSDSGISDEGSEHDVGERERRLSAIRRLVRQLEIVMAPDCIARIRMRDRLTVAEEELKNLQNKCRSIIVRTAVSATAPLSESAVAAGPGGDPDDEPKTISWFRRVVRASLSFQFAIVALLFVASLLDPPGCCDNMNNLQMSINPQLHYVRGPPPI